jgi:hypothetical protein
MGLDAQSIVFGSRFVRGIRPVVCAKLNQDALRFAAWIGLLMELFESKAVKLVRQPVGADCFFPQQRRRKKQRLTRVFFCFFELLEREYLILLGANSQYAAGKNLSGLCSRLKTRTL